MSFTPLLVHGFQQVDRAADVVLVVLQRHLNRFTHRLEAGEMDHRIDFFLPEQTIHRVCVTQICQVKLNVHTGQRLHPAEGVGLGIAEVVHDYDFVAGLEKFQAGMGTDVAGPACYEDSWCRFLVIGSQSNRLSCCVSNSF